MKNNWFFLVRESTFFLFHHWIWTISNINLFAPIPSFVCHIWTSFDYISLGFLYWQICQLGSNSNQGFVQNGFLWPIKMLNHLGATQYKIWLFYWETKRQTHIGYVKWATPLPQIYLCCLCYYGLYYFHDMVESCHLVYD